MILSKIKHSNLTNVLSIELCAKNTTPSIKIFHTIQNDGVIFKTSSFRELMQYSLKNATALFGGGYILYLQPPSSLIKAANCIFTSTCFFAMPVFGGIK